MTHVKWSVLQNKVATGHGLSPIIVNARQLRIDNDFCKTLQGTPRGAAESLARWESAGRYGLLHYDAPTFLNSRCHWRSASLLTQPSWEGNLTIMKTPEKPSAAVTDAAGALHRSVLRLFRVLRAGRQGEGLTLSRAGVLGYLYREGTATSSEVAAYLRVRPQSLTRLLAGLEEVGLIARRASGEDRRESLLEITEAGARLLVEGIRAQRMRLAQVMEQELTPAEMEVLRIAAGLMDRIAEKSERAGRKAVAGKGRKG